MFYGARKIKVTASLGAALAYHSDVVASADELIELADKQLYEAKQAGRNCSKVAKNR